MFVLLEEIKRGSLLLGFPQNHCIPNPPIAQTCVSVGGLWWRRSKKSDDRSRTQKTEEQMCCAKSTTFSQPHIDWLGRVTSACTRINVSPREHWIENHSNCIMLGYMSHFKILIQHYLRCLLRIAVTARSALTRLSDYIPLLHVIYECVRGTYFSLPRHCP